MEAGVWYVYLYNDMDEPQDISFMGDKYGKFGRTVVPLILPKSLVK